MRYFKVRCTYRDDLGACAGHGRHGTSLEALYRVVQTCRYFGHHVHLTGSAKPCH